MNVDITSHEQLFLTYPCFNHNTRMGGILIGDNLLTLIAASLHTLDNNISVYFLFIHICTQGIHITVPSQLLEWRYHLENQGQGQAVGMQGAPQGQRALHIPALCTSTESKTSLLSSHWCAKKETSFLWHWQQPSTLWWFFYAWKWKKFLRWMRGAGSFQGEVSTKQQLRAGYKSQAFLS